MPAVGSLPFIVLALLGFGFVIAIHEFGHFVFAKLAGVKVLRFSIGFGPIIAAKQIGETEYALSLLPLGGYVKMLGEENAAQGATEGDSSDPRSYVNASRPWKALILLGGVTFNLVSSWLILVGLAFHGMPMTPPVAAEVDPVLADGKGNVVESPARKLGIERGDRIVAIDGKTVRSFDDLHGYLASHGDEPVRLTVRRGGDAGSEIELGGREPVYPLRHGGMPSLGIEPPTSPSIALVKRTVGDAPADAPKAGERIVAIDGDALPSDAYGQLIGERLRTRIGERVRLRLRDEHGGERETAFTYLGDMPTPYLGVELPTVVVQVVERSAAAAAGVKPGDLIESVDGEPVRSSTAFLGLVSRGIDRDIAMRIRRDGAPIDVVLHAADLLGSRRIGVMAQPMTVGVLPYLPPGFSGDGVLAAAGVHAGDALLTRPPQRDADDDAVPEMLALSGVSQIDVPLDGPDALALGKKRSFGRSAIATRLFGARVVHWGDASAPLVEVEDRNAIRQTVSLESLSPSAFARLRETIRPEDWIAGGGVASDGRETLVALRGATAPPRWIDAKPRIDGLAIVLNPLYEPPYALRSSGEAFAIADDAAVDMVVTTLRIIPRFFRSEDKGGIDATRTLSGPIGIFTQFKLRAERLGFASFLKLVAVIGLNLFLVNLLPIPIVDGGQLVFLGIEALIRRPVPETVRATANYAGLALVLALMVFSLGIDIWRQLGWL